MSPGEAALAVWGFIAGAGAVAVVGARIIHVIDQRDKRREDLHAALRAGDVKQVRALMVVHRRAFSREMQGEVEVWLSDRGD